MRKLQANALITTFVALALACAVHLVRPVSIFGRPSAGFERIPRVLGEWSGYDMESGDYAKSVPNSSLLMRDYVDSSGRILNLTVVYGTDIADIHKPEYCFQGQGWSEMGSRQVFIHTASGEPHPARLLVLKDSSGGKVICIYWYAGVGGATDSLSRQRYRAWKSTFLSGRVRPSALVRILVAADDDTVKPIDDALAFASQVTLPVARIIQM